MWPTLVHAGTTALAFIAEAAARSIVLGCFAGLILVLARVRSVCVRLLFWRGVLIAALAMPILLAFTPSVRVHIPLPIRSHDAAATAKEPAITLGTIDVPAADGSELRTANLADPSLGPSDAPVASTPDWRAVLPVILLTAYVGTACLLFVRLLIGMHLARRLQKSCRLIRDAFVLRTLADCSRAQGLRADPEILESEFISAPVTLGVGRPAIVIPSDWRSWEQGELEGVLAHEVSHVARRDALIQHLSLIHRALFWFSPLAWWLCRHLADLAEQASDEAALASGADRRRYAETLLGFFAALEGARERVWWQGVSMAKAGQAEKRVEQILGWRGAMSSKLTKSAVVAFLAAAVPVVGLTAGVHQIDTYTDDEPATSASAQSPVTPASPAKAVIYPGPAPQTPVAPVALPAPASAPVGQNAPAAALPVPAIAEAPQANESVDEVREAVERAKDAVERAQEDLRAARAQIASQDSDDRERAYKVSTKAYEKALKHLESQRRQYAALVAQAREPEGRYRIVVGRYYDSGPRFVIVTKGQEGVTMSGSEEDAEHARSLRGKIPGDFIWFERDEKSYIIRDQATVDRAKKLWEPEEELGRKQEGLGKQQEALGKQQEELGKKMEQVRVKIPDLTSEMQALMAKMKELNSNGGTQEEIGELQSQIGELQSRVGEIQSEAGRQQSQIGREQGELGRKQGELGRQQGELGRQQGEMSREASAQMKKLLDDAIGRGIAQPE